MIEIQKLLGELSLKERIVLEYRFGLKDGEEYTLDEIGMKFGLSRERVRQLEAKALTRLRHPSRVGWLQEFL